MTAVVDVGCATHTASSVDWLIERFAPGTLYGFDPQPSFEETSYSSGRTHVILARVAAWVKDGTTMYDDNGAGSTIGQVGIPVPCLDFAKWLAVLLDKAEVVAKLDCVGSEYALCERLLADGLDERLKLLLVRWYDGPYDADRRRTSILERLACPVEEWTL